MTQDVFAPWADETQKPLISFKNVVKQFGNFTAIDDITLDIYPQEFFALLGPSGCGKTPLMRMLAGFETPSDGQILLDGQDVAGVAPNKRATNMMFQSYALFPHLSVWENIAFGLKREKKSKDEIATRVEEMLRLVQLGKFAQRKPHQISGGQRQRVALARALAKAPKLWLLDEPLGALDKKLRQETQFELMDIQETTGTTFVIVTHDQEEAMTVASRVAVMDTGTIKQVATPSEIYEAPNSTYVAEFIGAVNLISGIAQAREIVEPEGMVEDVTVAPVAEISAVEVTPAAAAPKPNRLGKWLHDKVLWTILGQREEETLLLPAPRRDEIQGQPVAEKTVENIDPSAGIEGIDIHWNDDLTPIIASNGAEDLDGQKVVLALRPEKLGISKEKPALVNTVQGKVLDIAYLGNISTYHVEIPGGQVLKAQTANTDRTRRADFTWEEPVWLSWGANAGVVLVD